MSAVWLTLTPGRPTGAAAVGRLTEADGAPAGYLAAWTAPRPGGLRAWAAIVDAGGPAAVVSLVLAPPGRRLAFDDPAVQQARRRVLAGRPADACTTLLSDDTHFEGALTAWRGLGPEMVPDDPFGHVYPARILQLGPGLIGRAPAPCGPTIERYGSASPWPADRFGGH